MKKYQNKNWLYRKYWVDKLSTIEMAKLIPCNPTTITKWMHQFEIKFRNISEARDNFNRKNPGYWGGKNHPRWKGGRFIDDRGYVKIFAPDHPRARKGKRYVFEHVLMAEKALGRYLRKNEIVHHVNGKKADNRNCNFLVCTFSYHKWLENRMTQLYQEKHFGHI